MGQSGHRTVLVRRMLLIGLMLAAAVGSPARAQDRQALNDAEAQYSVARRKYDAAMSAVVRARTQFIQAAQASEEYQAALKRVADGQSGSASARESVVAELRKNPKYQDLEKQKAAAEEKIQAARDAGNTDIQTFTALYNDKAKYTKQIKAMEDELGSKSGAASARQEWRDATKAVETLDARIKADAEDSPAVAEALKQLQALQPEMDSAANQVAQAQAAYNQSKQQALLQSMDQFNRNSMYIGNSSRSGGHWDYMPW